MSKRTEAAVQLHKEGYNCCQAVLAVFCEDYGLDRDMALKIACGMGGGLRCGEVCGAVSGAVMALGLECGHYLPGDIAQKEFCAKRTVAYMNAFTQAKGTVVCRELLGFDVRDVEARLTNKDRQAVICNGAITYAVELLESMIL